MNRPVYLGILIAAATSVAATLLASTASGALIAQSYDFGTGVGEITPATAGFSATTGGSNRTWSNIADAVRFTDSSGSGSYTVSTQSQSFADLSATSHFLITLDLTHVERVEEFTRFGILALGSGGDTGYAAVITQANGGASGTTGIRILRGGVAAGTAVASLNNSDLDDLSALLGDRLTLTLEGQYIGAGLQLTFTATDGTNTSSISYTDMTPLTGNFAGFAVRSRDSTTGSNHVTDYHSFAITPIPEPTSLVLLGVGSLGLLHGLRRRRLAKQ